MVYAAGVDERVAAVISTSGWGHGERKFRWQHREPGAFARFTAMLAEGKRHRERTGKSLMVPRYDIVPIPEHLRTHVVPGSVQVKLQAEAEGLDEVFRAAGFDWRGAGCSMCLGMNPDILKPGERCASTSNRNFEGRQGRGGRTHLVSPEMAAAAAIEGHFVDIREWS